MLAPITTIIALASALPLASAGIFSSSDSSSNFINGVHVSDAFQHQLRRDYEALGWNASSIVGSPDNSAVHDRHLTRRAKAKATAAKKRFTYGGGTKVRGVNLGGWLVTEPWMSPSLYVPTAQKHSNVVDEYTLCKQNGRAWCKKTLTKHFQTFITEQDLIDIQAAGLNHVRIPVGFWALDISGGEPYVQGQLPFLQQGVLWAQKHNLTVVMDLHGLPGSQNGQDNSGHRGTVGFYSSAKNVARSKAVLKALVAEFTKPVYGNTVTLYTPVNEPKVSTTSSALSILKAYYTAAWSIVHAGTAGGAYTFLGDAFLNLPAWASFMPSAQYPLTAFDRHLYTVFDKTEYKYTVAQRVQSYCDRRDELGTASTKHLVIVGEWSTAVNDCGQELKGITYKKGAKVLPIGMESRYAGIAAGYTKLGSCTNLSGDGSKFSPSYKQTLRRMFDAQVDAYEQSSAGWIMWAWHLEAGAADDWSYQAGLKYGWIPQDPTQRAYPNQCT